MKLIIVLFILSCLSWANARKLTDIKPDDEEVEVHNHESKSQMRHRRPSRRAYYDRYDPYDYENKRYETPRDYHSYQQEELLSKILNQIDELASYIKRPPPPPQQPHIIYIPVPYVLPQIGCTQSEKKPNITDFSLPPRFPDIEDNQNWGQVLDDPQLEVGGDGSRPIDLGPVEPDEPTVKPPPVEHGSSQAGMTTSKSAISQTDRCKAATLVCCERKLLQEKRKCFTDYGCAKSYSTLVSCRAEVVERVLNEFLEKYAPI